MPQIQRGEAYRLGPKRWGVRYYDTSGVRRRKSPFPSKSAALAHYQDVIELQLRGERTGLPELTLAVHSALSRAPCGKRSVSGDRHAARTAAIRDWSVRLGPPTRDT